MKLSVGTKRLKFTKMTTNLHPTELYLAIDAIRRRKKDNGIIPDYALRIKDIFPELRKYPQSEIDRVLRGLLDAGRIKTHRAANDVGIETL